MDLELSDDQELFRETTVKFIDAELPLTGVRALVDDPVGYDPDWLRRSADLGWYALFVPEAHGGGSISGSPLLDAAIVAEEIGRTVQPGPFLPMNVVAAAIAVAGDEDQQEEILPRLGEGRSVATWALADVTGDWSGTSGVVATSDGSGFRLNGAKGFVQDGQRAEWLLVSAALEDGSPAQFLVRTDLPGVQVEPLVCFDLARRMAEVSFTDVRVGEAGVLGTPGAGAAADLERQRSIALALQAAETAGVVDWMFSTSVQYSKDRVAFGRPIGSFQALKHVMADLALYVETVKATAVAAARAVAAGADDADEVVSMAKAYAGDVAVDVAQESLQIHGGIGYTWEHDLHLYLRRASVNAALYGSPAWHRERICRIHDLGATK